jgi:hypothetical protein
MKLTALSNAPNSTIDLFLNHQKVAELDTDSNTLYIHEGFSNTLDTILRTLRSYQKANNIYRTPIKVMYW